MWISLSAETRALRQLHKELANIEPHSLSITLIATDQMLEDRKRAYSNPRNDTQVLKQLLVELIVKFQSSVKTLALHNLKEDENGQFRAAAGHGQGR